MNRKNIFMRLPLLVILLLGMVTSAGAKQIDKETAASIAESFFNSRTIGKKGAVKTKSVSVDKSIKTVTAEPAYYVFAPEAADGFVIVSAEEDAAPIVGYSLETKFDGENLPEALKAYLSDYSQVVKAISDGKIEYKPQTKGGEAVAPLMKMKWNQGKPYDLYTPTIGSKQAPTGCVATAIAQVMKYYEFPPKGNGEVTCGYGSQELGHEYDWSNMLDEYTGWDESTYNYTEEQAQAVATLMRDVGYSVQMMYGENESGAYSQLIAAAMCNYFNYSPDIRFRYRTTYTTQAWIDEIRENLLRGEPVVYSGSDGGNSGHEFVCDGIDADDLVHINWGWGGMSDGYFDVSILSPDNLGIGAGNGAYYRDQDIVVNIRPGDPTADYLSERIPLTLSNITSYNETDADGKLTDQYSLSLSALCWNSTGAYVSYGDYSLGTAVKDDNGQLVGIYNPSVVSALNEGYYRSVSLYLPCSDMIRKGELPDGHYTMSIACIKGNAWNQNPEDYVMTDISAGDLNRLAFTVKDGTVYVDDPENMRENNTSKIKVLSHVVGGKLYTDVWEQEIAFKMKNEGNRLFSGVTLTMFLVPEAADKAEFTEEELSKYESGWISGIYLYPGVTLDVPAPLRVNDREAGRYRLYVGNYEGSEYKLKETDEPMWVDLVELPKDNVVISGNITNYWPETARNYYPWVNIKFKYINPMGRFQTKLEVWCREKGSDEADEFLLYKDEESRTIYGESELEFWGSGERKALWYRELGTEFEAYIKFVDKDGNLKKMDGNNTFEFTLVDDDSDVVVNLASPMVINDGKPVEAKDFTTFEANFEITTKNAMTIDESNCWGRVLRGPMSNDWVYSIVLQDFKVEKTELAAGETTKCNMTIMYYDYEPEKDLVGSTLCIEPFIAISDGTYSYSYTVQVMPYLESTAFALVEPQADAINDITADGPEYRLNVSGKSIIVENLSSRARVDVYNVSGVKIGEKTADADGTVTVDVHGSGIYLVRVTDAESGVASTVKVRI